VIFAVAVAVMPKDGISDPQGQTIERALPGQGFDGFEGVRVGKRIEFSLEAPDQEAAEEILERVCREFLSNPIIEDFRFSMRVVEGKKGRLSA
jgi:phosphoribosylformylglycinamidine synthase PurS subunit